MPDKIKEVAGKEKKLKKKTEKSSAKLEHQTIDPGGVRQNNHSTEGKYFLLIIKFDAKTKFGKQMLRINQQICT
jgi:hypothetical protein